jgi:phytoene synthase
MAFQLTNILRDIRTDAEKGRIYVPQEDLARFGYSEQDLLRRTYNLAFADLMRFEAERAHEYYAKAERALHALPPNERRALTVAEIMRGVYSRILRQIQASEFRVFERRVTLSTRDRLMVAAGVWLRSRWLPAPS